VVAAGITLGVRQERAPARGAPQQAPHTDPVRVRA
jgi:hypothetical protein